MCKKTAILICCHKNPQQVNALIDSLSHPNVDVFLHIDAKSNTIRNDIRKANNLFILPERCCVKVEWAKISQVKATLNLLNCAKEKHPYDYYIYISGEDYPCKPTELIANLALKQENRMQFWNSFSIDEVFNHYDKRNSLYFPNWIIGRSFFQRAIKRLYIQITGGYDQAKIKRKNTLNCQFYFGSSWWGLNGKTIDWMLNYLSKHPQFYKFYKNCLNPDESFFQTLFMLSPYGTTNTDFLTYLKFLPKNKNSKYTKNSPEYLNDEDIEKAKKSEYFFMRKICFNKDK